MERVRLHSNVECILTTMLHQVLEYKKGVRHSGPVFQAPVFQAHFFGAWKSLKTGPELYSHSGPFENVQMKHIRIIQIQDMPYK
jgi:hypothetical protein